MKSIPKTLILSVLSFLAQIFVHKPFVGILMYHSVGGNPSWKHAISKRSFEQQMAYVAKHFSVVPLADIVSYSKGEKNFSRQTVAITFDDIYRDTRENALPILSKYSFSVALFLTTDLFSTKYFAGTERPSVDDIIFLSQQPHITIGSHTHTHPHLDQMTYEEAIGDIEKSKYEIQKLTGNTCRYFSYPYGRRTKQIQESLATLGFEAACAVRPKGVSQKENIFALPRIGIDQGVTLSIFKSYLSHGLTLYYRIRHLK